MLLQYKEYRPFKEVCILFVDTSDNHPFYCYEFNWIYKLHTNAPLGLNAMDLQVSYTNHLPDCLENDLVTLKYKNLVILMGLNS